MTEPVARASVRRTVRVAVALVAGQAVLGGVIGWVTLGSRHADKPGAVPAVEPLAAKPLVIPPPRVVPAPKPPRSSARPSADEKKASASSSPPARSSPTPHRPASSLAVIDPRPPGQQSSPPGQPALALPSPTAGDDVQSPVRLLDLCDPVGAKGLTVAGISLLCVKGDDGTPHWQIN